MECKELLRALCAAPGVSGRETAAALAARELLAPLGQLWETPLGSLCCRLPGEGPTVMLTAHLDQIGLVVSGVTDQGFLRVASCGGVDRRLLPGTFVTVHGEAGMFPASVCSVPPHLKTGDDTPPKIEDLLVDTGLGSCAAKSIRPGDVVTFAGPFTELDGDRVSGPGLDDRAGCAAVIRAGELLGERGCGASVVLVLASMEEVGSQGAATAAYALDPAAAIAVDVSYGQGPGVEPHRAGQLGGGPMLGWAPILHRGMTRRLSDLARREGIPLQDEVMGGATGTDADGIAKARAGVPTALLSIPLRNMHTPVELVSCADVELTARLLALAVEEGCWND